MNSTRPKREAGGTFRHVANKDVRDRILIPCAVNARRTFTCGWQRPSTRACPCGHDLFASRVHTPIVWNKSGQCQASCRTELGRACTREGK